MILDIGLLACHTDHEVVFIQYLCSPIKQNWFARYDQVPSDTVVVVFSLVVASGVATPGPTRA